MIDKENKKTFGEKTHEGKILIYCGGNILLLRRWCHTSCIATYSSSGVSCVAVLLLLQRWCHASCVATYPSSSGVGVTDLCCDVLHRRWCHATGVAMYPFSHVKSKRLLPLVGNPRHETQSIRIQ